MVQRIHRAEQANGQTEPPTIHHTELRPDTPDSPVYQEWETYRREVGRLLAEGNEGRWAVIKGEKIIALFDDYWQAMHIAQIIYHRQPPFLVHQVREREPILICYNLWRYINDPHIPPGEKAGPPQPPPEQPTIHYTELTPAKPDSPLYQEWETYRREVGRLLAEGNEHRWVLIKGEQVVGQWNTRDKAILIGYCKFPNQAFLVHQIREREPLLINKYLWHS